MNRVAHYCFSLKKRIVIFLLITPLIIKDHKVPGIERTSFIFLILLFPCAFFYHAAVGLNYTQPLLTGYISIVGAIATAVLISHEAIHSYVNKRIEKRHIYFFIFAAAFTLVSGFYFFTGNHADNAKINILLALNLIACYLIFSNINITNTSYKHILVSSAVAMSAVIIGFSEHGVFDFSSKSVNHSSVANYQTFALAYLPVMMVSIVKTESKLWRYSLFATAIYCLYLNGARSEFVAILIFFSVYEVSISGRRLCESVFVIFFAAATISSIFFVIPQSDENRTLRLAYLSEDNSSNVRHRVMLEGIEKISNSPILGDYGNYDTGLYIHNILSAWQDLGLFGFIYFCLMMLIPLLYYARKSLLRRDTSKGVALCLGMLTTTIILLIYGKYFAYPLVAITFGMISSLSRVKILEAPINSK